MESTAHGLVHKAQGESGRIINKQLGVVLCVYIISIIQSKSNRELGQAHTVVLTESLEVHGVLLAKVRVGSIKIK